MDKVAWLIPRFLEFGTQSFESQLSTVFVAVLLGVTAIFSIISGWHFVQARRRIKWLEKQLAEASFRTIASKRSDLCSTAKNEKKAKIVRRLWLEFDKTLVEVKEIDVRLYNTVDAAYFFNATTLAKGITDNRLIAAVPGFLTAIGVIGTFVGLQIGLSEINISSNVSVDEMKSGVSAVIGGAKVAFMTSVWGVFLSVVFNFFEKLLELNIRAKIHSLQNLIDGIFPRLSPESQLQKIAENSTDSRESLQGLAEKIGDKMQESMVGITEGVTKALETTLNDIMAPAINKLVNETSEGNQKALEDLLRKFMSGFSTQGRQQRVAMENAAEQVSESIIKMNSTMDDFIHNIEASQKGSGNREQEFVNNIENQIKQLTEGISSQSAVLTEFVGKQVMSLTDTFEEREKNAGLREKVAEVHAKSRDAALAKQTNAISESTQNLVRKIEESIHSQQEGSKQVLQQGESLQQNVKLSIQASDKATENMRQSAVELKSAAESVKTFGSYVKDAGSKLSGAIVEVVDTTKNLANQNQVSSERMEKLRSQLLSDTAKFKEIADQIENMVGNVDNTFEQLRTSQSEYLQELKSNVSELSKQMTALLSDYAMQANSQTENHLKIWSNSSTQYAETMNNAMRALSGVVDEIQDKVGA